MCDSCIGDGEAIDTLTRFSSRTQSEKLQIGEVGEVPEAGICDLCATEVKVYQLM